MFNVNSPEEFVSEVKKLDEKLTNTRITSIEINKNERRIKYTFICEHVISEELSKKVWMLARKYTSEVFSKVNVYFNKIVCNDELINNEIYKYINTHHPSVSIFLKQTDVRSVVQENLVKYVVKLTADGADYMTKSGAFVKLNTYLSTKFCSDFIGSAEIKEAEETIDILSDEVYLDQIEKVEYRTIKVKDVVVLDDFTMGNTAVYIEDALSGYVTVCGKITEITEKQTKTGKPFFIIHIDDTTGRMSGVYFTRKSTVEKIRFLKEGDGVIMSGNIGEYNGRRSFTIEKINRCTFPEDFVKKDRYKKKAPLEYKKIFPTPATTVKISSVFDDNSALPAELTEKTYVVFDLETTGLDLMSNGITEIGAVKIVNGKLTEQFTTLIKPDYPITEENFAITGISEEMVKDAPKISSVIPDFMKFIDGSVLVAQNAEFDMKFIKRFAGAEDYEVKNPVMDTMELSRKHLPFLRRNDLHTLAEHFNITFHHHRAMSDAYATAEVFIEIMKIKNKN